MSESTPQWAYDVINRALDYVVDTTQVFHASREGLNNAEKIKKILEEAMAALGDEANVSTERLEELTTTAQWASVEVANGHPTLNAHYLVGAWAGLDAMIPDLIVAFLLNVPRLLDAEPFQKIKIPLAEYHQLGSPDERMEYLVTMVARNHGGEFGGGIIKYENMLGMVGMSGPLDPDLKKNLLAAGEIRNLIVHRAGVVDRKAASACPWLDLKVGAKHNVSDREVHHYVLSIINYLKCLQERVAKPQASPGAPLSARPGR